MMKTGTFWKLWFIYFIGAGAGLMVIGSVAGMAKKSMGDVKVGEVLEIWSGDDKTKEDMPRWCQKVGHEYLGDSLGDGYDRLFIRRMK